MIRYINRKGQGYTETVDEFPFNTREERKEARRCLSEYILSDNSASYWLSQRACKDWN